MVLSEKPILKEQEQEGDYNFSDNVQVMKTIAFVDAFGEESAMLCTESLRMINDTYKNPDYLQCFEYKGINYWCISNFRVGEKASDYENLGCLYMTFLLPSDY